MSTAPRVDIDMPAFWRDPYPVLANLRAEAPVAFVPQLGGTVFAARDDIFVCEKLIDVFSSHQPDGLMSKLMGVNLMRKDGDAHLAERKAIFPSVSPKTVRAHWTAQFQAHAERLLDGLDAGVEHNFFKEFAMPFSAQCLKSITGLTNIRFEEMDAWSQAMIDGIANYTGDPAVEARCHNATAGIDLAIDGMVPVVTATPNMSLLSVMLQAGLPMDSIRANIRLAISGGQNEPRDAIAGTVWALLTHPDQLAIVRAGEVTWLQAFEEYARWISPIGMSPRRIAKPYALRDIDFTTDDRIFFLYGSANRDERHFSRGDVFDVQRDVSKSIAFGAGPHFCAGAFASRAMIADVALPLVFNRLRNLRIADGADVPFGGWAFRGPLSLPVIWDN